MVIFISIFYKQNVPAIFHVTMQETLMAIISATRSCDQQNIDNIWCKQAI